MKNLIVHFCDQFCLSIKKLKDVCQRQLTKFPCLILMKKVYDIFTLLSLEFILFSYQIAEVCSVSFMLCNIYCGQRSWQWLLGPKNFKQIYLQRTKGTYCGYMGEGDYKKIKNQHSIRLKHPPIWTDWAEHASCYCLKECWNLIFL